MRTVEDEVNDWDLENAGWIHEDDLEDKGYIKVDAVEEYLFKNNPEITPALKDILDIIGVETWRLKSE